MTVLTEHRELSLCQSIIDRYLTAGKITNKQQNIKQTGALVEIVTIILLLRFKLYSTVLVTEKVKNNIYICIIK